eukprot:2542945-Ditylum_brightwellii.AAC.2
MEAIVQQLIVASASLTLLVVITIAHTKAAINIAWADTTMITARTTTYQAEIATVNTKATMPTKIVTVIDMTIIMKREAKEATVVMTVKQEIAIVL